MHLDDQGAGFSADATGPVYDQARAAFTDAWGSSPWTSAWAGPSRSWPRSPSATPDAAILVTGVEDPDARAHGANESLHLGEFQRVCEAEASARTARRACPLTQPTTGGSCRSSNRVDRHGWRTGLTVTRVAGLDDRQRSRATCQSWRQVGARRRTRAVWVRAMVATERRAYVERATSATPATSMTGSPPTGRGSGRSSPAATASSSPAPAPGPTAPSSCGGSSGSRGHLHGHLRAHPRRRQPGTSTSIPAASTRASDPPDQGRLRGSRARLRLGHHRPRDGGHRHREGGHQRLPAS